MVKLEQTNVIDLLFGDESGFSLEPCIPYGWLPVGKQSHYPCEHTHVGNVFGLLSRFGHGKMHWTHNRIDSQFILKCLDDLTEQIHKPTVVVLDNAPWHRANLIKQNISKWQKKNLYIFYLPPYSPHLNMIEMLWRKIKYEWLEPHHYISTNTLKDAVINIFKNLGNQFNMKLSDNFLTDN